MSHFESMDRPASSFNRRPRSYLIGWLLDRQVCQTENSARHLLYGIILFNFIIAGMVFYFFAIQLPTNGLVIIHSEATTIYHALSQNDWFDAWLYVRLTLLLAIGDVIGLLVALKWLWLVIGIILFGKMIYQRLQP